jgi:CheY-like chemotaxis protein
MSLVLIAEDEPPTLEILTEIVSGLGNEVVRASDGETALAEARRRRPDLVVTDFMMPRRSGLELIRAMREDDGLEDVPVLLISAARPRGADLATHFLPKPLVLRQFEEAVLRLLRQREGRCADTAETPVASIDLVEALRTAVSSWRSLCEPSHQIALVAPESGVFAAIDPRRLRLTFDLLLVEAIERSAAAKRVDIELRALERSVSVRFQPGPEAGAGDLLLEQGIALARSIGARVRFEFGPSSNSTMVLALDQTL